MEIRSTDSADWFRLKRIRVRALVDSLDAFASSVDEERSRRDEEWKARASAGPSSSTFLAIQHGEAVGMGGVDGRGAEQASLVGMWVDPGYRNRGIGRPLIAAAAACAPTGTSPSCTSESRNQRLCDHPLPVVWLRRHRESRSAAVESDLERDRMSLPRDPFVAP
jgi:GNAT superfamily N-acetyltransferase